MFSIYLVCFCFTSGKYVALNPSKLNQIILLPVEFNNNNNIILNVAKYSNYFKLEQNIKQAKYTNDSGLYV